MDAIFKALSDPTRRQLLDSLRDKGGLTLTELEQGLGMTRFGVMKHLRVLGSVGEPIAAEVWKWYFEVVGKEEAQIVDVGLPGCSAPYGLMTNGILTDILANRDWLTRHLTHGWYHTHEARIRVSTILRY